ncbi:hypothetical protein C4544_05680 [candidate division WS5 bacterium]|uniref:DUF4386 family protein n=1 Tax=candidate division WS5 bacterium TaxID=2093353 RepID=A0A419DAT1_9BACT|nr:MAG: hypothetical protein C4544_05680 [candidate division WS5 bacterium]
MIKASQRVEKTQENLNKYSVSIQTAVSFAGLFAALSLFFTGLIITNYNQFSSSVRIPILFLIISTFGFLYATLIYVNATTELSIPRLDKCKRAVDIGNIISEYMGVYFLIFSIPLVITVISSDPFLRWSVLIVNLAGLVIYHLSRFSMMDYFFGKIHYLLLSPLLVMEVLLFLFLDLSQSVVFIITTILMGYVGILTLASLKSLTRIKS